MIYSYTEFEGSKTISLIFKKGMPVSVGEGHKKFDEIDTLRSSGELNDMSEEDVLRLLSETESTKWTLKTISEDSGYSLTIYGLTDSEGNEIDSSLGTKLAQALGDDPDNEDRIRAMLRFLIRAKENPSMPDSDKLYNWIFSEKLTLTPDGHFLGYKSVDPNDLSRGLEVKLPNGDLTTDKCAASLAGDQDVYWSHFSGGGITNGVEFPANVPQWVGSVVEMPRDKVDSDGRVECSVGLHVGTYGYASTFHYGISQLLLVKVDPRDVVSVPEYDFTKLRTCRYTVVGEVDDILDVDLWVDDHFAPHIEPDPLDNDEEDDLESITEAVIEEIMKRIRELG